MLTRIVSRIYCCNTFWFQENCAHDLLMAAEHKAGELSCSPAVAEGHHESLNSASQVNCPVWVSRASVAQSHATSSPRTPILSVLSIQNVPTVHVTGHPFAVCSASSASTTPSSFSPYKCHMVAVSSANTQDKGSVCVNPVPQQQNTVTARTVPTVRLASQPTAVLDLSNNGILNTVLGRLPNIGTMVVQQLDPGSPLQKNVLAMIDNRTPIVTTATAVISMQPGSLTLPYHGTMALQPSRQVTSQIVRPVSQASQLQHSLQPVVVNQTQLREPMVACSLTAKQPVLLPQSSATVSHSCMSHFSSLNLPIARSSVVVRTLSNSSGHAQMSLSMATSDGTRCLSANSAQVVPQIKLPHTASSLPDALVRCHTTTAMQPMQQSNIVLANQPALKIQHNVSSLPMQTQLLATFPPLVTNVSRNGIYDSSHRVTSSSTLPPSESLTAIIPAHSTTAQFAVPQSDAKGESVSVVHSTTQLPLVAGTDVQTCTAHLATSLIHIPICTHMSSSSTHYTRPTFAPYVSRVPVTHFTVPAATLLRGQMSCSAETKKRSVKRAPRKKTEFCHVFSNPANPNHAQLLTQVFHSSAVGMPVTSLTDSVAPMMVKPLQHTSTACPTTRTVMAGVKRKCIPEQKYTLLLKNGCKYSSVYFDGQGFQAKKPAFSSVITGN